MQTQTSPDSQTLLDDRLHDADVLEQADIAQTNLGVDRETALTAAVNQATPGHPKLASQAVDDARARQAQATAEPVDDETDDDELDDDEDVDVAGVDDLSGESPR